ncbi:hypothetical protein NC652_011574 [Populus alba x Populus x berolinensis]|nr:hypothetical protein NC652_011574 [Populus alba x Populus x berolinensis]
MLKKQRRQKNLVLCFSVAATDKYIYIDTHTHTQLGRMMAIKSRSYKGLSLQSNYPINCFSLCWLQSAITVGVGLCNLCGKMSVLQEESILESEFICSFPPT